LKIGGIRLHLNIKNPFGVKTPKGYSCLFVDPMHGDAKPFKCLPAIVDTDEFTTPLNFPFFLDKNFSGIIPCRNTDNANYTIQA